MANYANLEAAIQAAIYENNTNDITGAALQSVLLQMVSSMGKSGMLCNGVADGSTTPPVNPDSNIFYIAPTGTYPNFGGLVVADGEWAIFIYNGSWQKQSVPVVTADAVPTTGSTNPVQSGGVANALEQKADIDGYYSTLTAGSAENLIGRGTVPAEYTRRTSGGSADIGSGAAAIEKIHGNTIAWNQLVPTNWFATNTPANVSWTNNGDGSYTINGTASGVGQVVAFSQPKSFGDHKYYLATSDSNIAIYFNGTNANQGTYTDSRQIVTAQASDTYYPCIRFQSGATFSNKKVYIKIIDLTLMFGAGNEPTSVAQFEALFPLNYYAYNTGSLLSLTGTGIETNGFNQWDEEWELGTIDGNGQDVVNYTRIRSKGYIPVFPNTTYYFRQVTNDLADAFCYDSDHTYLGHTSYTASGTGYLITTLPNTAYLRFNMKASYGTTYKGDICINISWSGYRNGEYEAYWDSTLDLPLTSVTSGGSAVFADGMKSAMAAYDELTSSKAVKRIGIVDLGSLAWDYDGTYKRFYATLTGSKRPADNSLSANMLGAIYTTTNFNAFLSDTTLDKTVAHPYNNDTIQIRNLAYTTAAAFTTAMNGVYLVYELDTPVEYTLDSEVNLNYRVDDFGTETLLPQNNATPTTAPIIYDVRYAMNAVDTLRNLPKNYISKDSMEHILTAMVTAGVISAYTLTWNATNENYDCTITA